MSADAGTDSTRLYTTQVTKEVAKKE